MKSITRTKFAAVSLAAVMAMATACSSGSGSTASPSASAPPASPSASAAPAAKAEPLGKYDPPIEVSTVRYTDSSFKFKEGESLDNNVWTKAYESLLGIKVKNKWIVNGDQFNQKMNLSITSNDLPDMFMVDAKQLRMLAEEGLLEDLTKLVDSYGTPLTKEMINRGANAKAAATYKGKLYAIPPAEDYLGGAPLLWVRTDWLKKLNLPEPKTMNDLLTIADAFSNQDPDGNGKKDTYGLAVSKDIASGYPDLAGFMNGYHAYMNIWIKDTSGKLVYGSIQPEMKTALGKLQELYKAGVIDKEFGVKDGGKVAEMQSSGKIGMNFGAMWNPLWPLQDNVKADPNAEWAAYPVPSADGTPAKAQATADFNSFWVVKKGVAHPEALVKLFNLYNEKIVSANAETKTYHVADGMDVFKYAIASNGFGTPQGLLTIHKNVIAALKSGNSSALVPEEKDYFDKIKLFQGGDRTNWGTNKVFGEGGSWAVIGKNYVDSGLLMKNEYYGPATDGMSEKKAILDKLVLETFTKIILGSPLSDFDKFVSDWNKLGGEQITKEVNDWYNTRS